MAVETLRFVQPTQTDTGANYSDSLWGDCPINALRDGTQRGYIFEDDFLSFNKTPATTEGNWAAGGGYAQFSSSGGTITAGTGQGGEAVLTEATDDEGVSFRTLSTPFKISRSTLNFWFECRIKTSTIADTKHNIIVGLMQDVALTATMPITAAGAIADTNIVGFRRTEAASGGALLDTFYKADGVTAVTVQAGAVTLAADTYVKLGIKFDAGTTPFNSGVGDGYGKYLLSFYANGVLLGTQKQIPSAAGTDFPNDVGLGLVIATLNATGTTPGTTTIDKWRAAQLLL